MSNKSPAGSQSIIRALRILKSLGAGEACLDALATEMKLNKSTVHRILKALISEGFVEQDPITRKYHLSYGVLKLSASAREQISFRRHAIPILDQLAAETEETVHLSVRAGNQVVCIEKVESPKPFRIHSAIGAAGPMHCTGSGKCLLAFMPETESESILNALKLKRFTDTTITNLDDLRTELKRIRERGASFDIEEHDVEVMCVAAPVYDHTEEVIAAISLALPTSRRQEDLEKLSPSVVRAADELSYKLGYRNLAVVTRSI